VRFLHRDGSTVHLAYCTNVHPAEDLDGIVTQLNDFSAAVRRHLETERLGVGLWLAEDVARRLSHDRGDTLKLRAVLDGLGLEVVTLNGFPYKAFHAPVVKLAVYEPDWGDPARSDHTLRLASVLSDLLPEDVTAGSISTLPLAWREGWDLRHADRCRAELERVGRGLAELEERTGKFISLGIEPEPGCIVETTAQAAAVLEAIPDDRLGVCLDTCHMAVQFEEPARSIALLGGRGVGIVKSQLACALRVEDPSAPEARAALEEFTEPRFLHQTRTCNAVGAEGVDDLPLALAGGLASGSEWRVHFHTAIHASAEAPLGTTQDVLIGALDGLVGGARALTHHLEVETYTWAVLPPDRRPTNATELIEGMAEEISWARDRLVDLGLEEVP
jgi:sugar phosphate isomerase/epimerase